MAEPRRRARHIGIDARELVGQPTGVGRFLRELLREWATSADLPHRFTLFLPGPGPDWVVGLGSRFTTVIDPADPAGTWWEQVHLPRLVRQAGIDLLFSPAYTAPLRIAVSSAVVVHDVSFFAHPEWFGWREGLRRRWLTKAAAGRARVVMTVSDFSASEIERWMGVPRDRIRVIRHGAPEPGTMPSPARSPVVLFVGSLFNRRRLPELLAGFARATSGLPDARLILVGDNRTSPRIDPLSIATGLGIGNRVEWRAYVSDVELERLYGSARVFAFLSDYEGFAMTPLEALAHGAPSVLLDTPVAREIYGSAARFVPLDVGRIADALKELLTDDQARAALLANGPAILAQHSWATAASEVLDALDRAV